MLRHHLVKELIEAIEVAHRRGGLDTLHVEPAIEGAAELGEGL